METRLPRVFTMAPSADFLGELAEAVLAGFPHAAPPTPLALARTTILLPTRRAARALEKLFFEKGGGAGLLLPRIRPIGDIDEDLFEDRQSTDDPAGDLPDAISATARQFLLMDLAAAWASENPTAPLAREIAASARQSLNLALSLAELVDGLETEDLDVGRLPELYDLDQARHRAAILDFLSLVKERLPARLLAMNLLGPRARRSIILRREARRLAENPPPFPVIAAGSTGSIPATRELLAAIARLPQGAVIVPSLDTVMDEPSWASIGEQHPQFAIRQMLESFGVARADVVSLGPSPSARDWLSSELMRPPATSDAWREVVAAGHPRLTVALTGLEFAETRDLREEAQVIALMLRKSYATEGETACLVTPDRELARRVKQELAEAGIAVDDSAGEPLARFGAAALLDLLIEVAMDEASPRSLLALLRHPLCTWGEDEQAIRRAVDVIDVAVYRNAPLMPSLAGLADALRRARSELANDSHPAHAVLTFGDENWRQAESLAIRIAASLGPVLEAGEAPLAAHLDRLMSVCEAIAGGQLYDGEEGEPFRTLIALLRADAAYLERCGMNQALVILRHQLNAVPLRRTLGEPPRLAIFGLLEARLARPQVMILGGLNEGVWPALPDAGPWLNRPMRTILGMAQPERQIGQTAHDFVQALGATRCALVWARRLGDAPAVPSRWLLRLRMLMAAAGLKRESDWPALARRLLAPEAVTPAEKPRPRPPAAARPRRLSVTRIETLIRDPYAVYAQAILRLEPLNEPGIRIDYATRGTLFHAIVGEFTQRFPKALPDDAERQFMTIADRHFAPYAGDPRIAAFWWGQMARLALWLVTEEQVLRAGLRHSYAECGGKLEMTVAGQPFALTARADRIDVLADGQARLIDYKTGAVPSNKQVKTGLAPQLTLEAAMLEAGAFRELGKCQTAELVYIKLSGGNPPGEVGTLDLKGPVMAVAADHLARLRDLLAAYADAGKAYFPRAIAEREDEPLDYDHLSRFREWSLSGKAP